MSFSFGLSGFQTVSYEWTQLMLLLWAVTLVCCTLSEGIWLRNTVDTDLAVLSTVSFIYLRPCLSACGTNQDPRRQASAVPGNRLPSLCFTQLIPSGTGCKGQLTLWLPGTGKEFKDDRLTPGWPHRHLTDEKTKIQRSWVTSSRSHS